MPSFKSFIVDCTNNHGHANYVGIRSIDFYNGGSKITLLPADFTAYATSQSSSDNSAKTTFDTSLLKTGDDDDREWFSSSGNNTNQRLICVVDVETTFDQIRINNFHDSGANTDIGAKDVKLYITSDTITDTTYGASITNSTKIFDSSFTQHISSNVEDEEILTLIPTTEPFDIVSGVPVLTTPICVTNSGGVDNIVTEVPVLGTPIAAVLCILAGIPVLGTPSGFISVILNSIITDIPVLESPDVIPFGVVDSILTGVSSVAAAAPFIDDNAITSLALQIPIALTMKVSAAITMALPSFNSDIVGTSGDISNISTSLPTLIYNTYAGSLINTKFLSLTYLGNIQNQLLVSLDSQLPFLSCLISGRFQADIDMEASFKAFQVAMNCISGDITNLSASLPKLRMQSNLSSEIPGDLLCFLPSLQADITSIITGDNDLAATISMLTCRMKADPLSDYILSYVKGKVR